MASRFWTRGAAGAAAILALQLTGCGGGPELPPMAPVSGKVTLNGTPLTRGTVQFVPDKSQGTQGPPALGMIGPDGRYSLKTAGVEGAIVGHHKVRVESRQQPKDETDTMPPSLIPERYGNENASGLAFEVQAGQKNDIPISLTSP